MVSPAVALVRTPVRQGTGVLIEGRYVVTAANIVWPSNEVRVLFPDGSDYSSVPVVAWDLNTDLAVLGPIETTIDPIVVASEDVAMASDVYLIGHPALQEGTLQPAVRRGLISRIREWAAVGMTYFETDIPVEAGQSGSPLITANGSLLGITGHVMSHNDAAFASSAREIVERVSALVSGDDPLPANWRRPPSGRGHLSHEVDLDDYTGQATFLLDAPIGSGVDIAAVAEAPVSLAITDTRGGTVLNTSNVGSGTIISAGPHMVTLSRNSDMPAQVQLTSNRALVPYPDLEEGRHIVPGDTVVGAIDYSSDMDHFVIELTEGEVIEVLVESASFSPSFNVRSLGSSDARRGTINVGSTLANNSKITYRAPFHSEYVIAVWNTERPSSIGGYVLSVATASPDVQAVTILPYRGFEPVQPNNVSRSEREVVQLAMVEMMAEAAVKNVTASTNSVKSWVYYPQTNGAEPLYPSYLTNRTTEFFYCWDSEGTITYQFSVYVVCPPPPLPPGTPFDGMQQPRAGHTSTRLPDGTVLIVGGEDDRYRQSDSVEIFNPQTGKWISATGMGSPRANHTATVLDDGQVLIAGGMQAFFETTVPDSDDKLMHATELYDPSTGGWSLAGGMSASRTFHSAVRLPDGMVMVAGGFEGEFGSIHRTAEVYDPADGSWANAGSMTEPRALHSAAVLPDGNLLVAGGLTTQERSSGAAEIFDPRTGVWTQTGSMSQERAGHVAAVLPDGRVLVAGGLVGTYDPIPLSSAEVYDPADGTWSNVSSMNQPRGIFFTASVLPDGRVFVAGGDQSFGNPLSSAEIYDPAADKWSTAADLTERRSSHTATVLEDGRVIVIGGQGDYSDKLGSAEMYDPETETWTYIAGAEPTSLLEEQTAPAAERPAARTYAEAQVPRPRLAPTAPRATVPDEPEARASTVLLLETPTTKAAPEGLPIALRGSVTARTDGTSVDYVSFQLSNASQTGEAVDLAQTVVMVSYADAHQSADAIGFSNVPNVVNETVWGVTWLSGTGPSLDPGERVSVTLNLRGLERRLGPDTEFTIEIKVANESPLVVTRTTPANLTAS